jgi:hypothetical protein
LFIYFKFFKDIHGLFMLFSWGFLADIGVILVRHFKVHKNYIKFHYNVFKFVDVFTIVFSLLIYLKVNTHIFLVGWKWVVFLP